MRVEEKVLQQVTRFIQGGDNSDTELLKVVLHDGFTNIQNGFLEKKGLVLISKNNYLSLIASKTFGGSPRTMEVQQIDIEGNIAMVKVLLKSEALLFKSFISLIESEEEGWKVIGNFPHIEKNNAKTE
jgi:hypothetical protein